VADQSLLGRLSAKVLPVVSKRVFPSDWLDAGDDRTQLAAVAKKRRSLDGPRPDAVLQRKWGRATTEIAGRQLHLLTPKAGSTGRLLFYCHGGAFVIGPSAIEWLFAAKVADRLGCDLALYDYPKVPETDSTTIREAMLAAYRTIDERYDAGSIVIAGTSAGGGLGVSTMLQLHRDGRDLPTACVLFSPWLDMTVSHPDVGSLVDSEMLLPLDQLRRDGELYAGPIDPKNPLVSPRFTTPADLAAMPPFVVTAGESEILLPEARELVGNLTDAGIDAHLVVEPHGQHGGIAGAHPEAVAALAECIDLVQTACRK